MSRHPPRGGEPRRAGFTVAELTVAVVILAVALTLVAQLGIQSLHERARASAHLTAQEAAANVLEAARACPWDKLTAEWAARQRLPEANNKMGWKLKVQVGPEPSRPQVKRVEVEVHWLTPQGKTARPVRLVELFAPLTQQAQGKKP